MSWGDGVPTYADELKENLGRATASIGKLQGHLDRARTAWRVIREHLDTDADLVQELDRALGIL